MFRRYRSTHVCTIGGTSSAAVLPPLPIDANCFQILCRIIRKMTLIYEGNPKTSEFYRSEAEITRIKLDHVTNYPYVIHPFSLFRVLYEMYMCAVYLVALTVLPLVASFVPPEKSIMVLDEVARVLCLIDVLVNFITGYVLKKKKIVVLSAKKIAMHYAFNVYFITDVLSSIPWHHTRRWTRVIQCLGFLKIIRLPTFYFYFMDSADFCRCITDALRFVKYLVITMLILHWLCCAHHLAPQLRSLFTTGESKDEYRSWTYHEKLANDGLRMRYTKTFFRVCALMFCMHTHQAMPEIWQEYLMDIATYIFGHLYITVITVMMLQIFLLKHSLQTKYYEKMSQVTSYMRQKRLPLSLQQRIENYYFYKYQCKYFKENLITDLLSDNLKKEINMFVCKKLVQNVSLFADLPIKVVEDLLTQMKPEIFLPNDVIIKAGAPGDAMYFLASGTVSVSTPSGKEVCHLQDGAYFGEVTLLFKDKRRTANIISIETCQVYKLDRKHFTRSFMSDPELLAKLHKVANDRMAMTQLIEYEHKQTFYLSYQNEKELQAKRKSEPRLPGIENNQEDE